MSTFIKELEELINKHSVENHSNTPDYILAQYITDCLNTFNRVTAARDKWYGINKPGKEVVDNTEAARVWWINLDDLAKFDMMEKYNIKLTDGKLVNRDIVTMYERWTGE
jgi:hypothetical protein